jgi:hypothetical protein
MRWHVNIFLKEVRCSQTRIMMSKFRLRYGVGRQSSAYGGNLGTRMYGLIPMPGIVSLEVRSKSAYGSLREATVKYVCWDKKQLDELEILYMRPGYTVLLEWGWSMYMDTFEDSNAQHMDISGKLNNHTLIKPFTSPTINPFQPGITQDDMYRRIRDLQEKFSGNYEGCVGKIMNFSYSLMPNGGYECTTVLISIGEVLDTLKMNSSTGITDNDEDNKDFKTEFEKLLDRFKPDNYKDDSVIQSIEQTVAHDGIDTSIKVISFDVQTPSFKTGNNRNYHYIQLAYFVHLLNERYNLYSGKSKLLNLEIPVYSKSNIGNGLCLASRFSISVDPEVCIIRNSHPDISFLTRNKEFDLTKQALRYKNTTFVNGITTNTPLLQYGFNEDCNDFLLDAQGETLGITGNIYVSIDMICTKYQNISKENKGTVGIGVLMKAILEEINFALGSVNDFDIYVQENNAVIIDKSYTEWAGDAAYSGKFEFNLIGNDSVAEQINLTSKIFPNQSTLVAIAAGARNNIAGVQTSTNVYLNRGLTDRLIQQSVEWASEQQDEEKKLRDELIDGNKSLITYVTEHLMKGQIPDSSSKNTANSLLNSLILKLTNDANYRAIVPLCLDVTLEGISGVVIGQIFTINKDVLPTDYYDKKIGFIVTGIAHTIDRAKWKTTYTTQICLLDQEKINKRELFSVVTDTNAAIVEGFKNVAQSICFYNMLVAFTKDYLQGVYSIGALHVSDRQYLQPNLLYDESKLNRKRSVVTKISTVAGTAALSADNVVNLVTNKQLLATIIENQYNDTGHGSPLQTALFYFGMAMLESDYRNKVEIPDMSNGFGQMDVLTQYVKNDKAHRLRFLGDVVKNNYFYHNLMPELKQAFDTNFAAFMKEVRTPTRAVNIFNLVLPSSINNVGKLGTIMYNENALMIRTQQDGN